MEGAIAALLSTSTDNGAGEAEDRLAPYHPASSELIRCAAALQVLQHAALISAWSAAATAATTEWTTAAVPPPPLYPIILHAAVADATASCWRDFEMALTKAHQQHHAAEASPGSQGNSPIPIGYDLRQTVLKLAEAAAVYIRPDRNTTKRLKRIGFQRLCDMMIGLDEAGFADPVGSLYCRYGPLRTAAEIVQRHKTLVVRSLAMAALVTAARVARDRDHRDSIERVVLPAASRMLCSWAEQLCRRCGAAVYSDARNDDPMSEPEPEKLSALTAPDRIAYLRVCLHAHKAGLARKSLAATRFASSVIRAAEQLRDAMLENNFAMVPPAVASLIDEFVAVAFV